MEESVDKLRTPITDGKVQLEGCRVLESLSEFGTGLDWWSWLLEESIQYFCDMGVIPVLIKAMRARGRDSRFQASACNVVRRIGHDGKDLAGNVPNGLDRVREMVFQNNGVENIVKSMLNFPDHEDIQENACFALKHFVQSGRSPKTFFLLFISHSSQRKRVSRCWWGWIDRHVVSVFQSSNLPIFQSSLIKITFIRTLSNLHFN